MTPPRAPFLQPSSQHRDRASVSFESIVVNKSVGAVETFERVGDAEAGLQIWEGFNPWHKLRSPQERWFYLYDATKDRMVGLLQMTLEHANGLEEKCRDDFAYVAVRMPVESKRLYRVHLSFVDVRYRGKGAGVSLYLAALAAAWRGWYALSADGCYEGSETSDEARRVWASKAFQARAVVAPGGLVAAYRPAGLPPSGLR